MLVFTMKHIDSNIVVPLSRRLRQPPTGGSVGIAGGNQSEIIFTDDNGKVHPRILSRDHTLAHSTLHFILLPSLSMETLF